MGFAAVGAVAILLGVGVYAGSIVAVASFDGESLQHQQEEARHLRDLREKATAMSFDAMQYNPGLDRVRSTLTNTGSAVLDASLLVILVDGAVVSTDAYTIDGQTSDVWAPGQELIIDATSTTSPLQVAIVSQDGIAVYWRA